MSDQANRQDIVRYWWEKARECFSSARRELKPEHSILLSTVFTRACFTRLAPLFLNGGNPSKNMPVSGQLFIKLLSDPD